MKKLVMTALALSTVLITGSIVMGKGGPSGSPQIDIRSLPKESISQKEKEGLILMREEEKLARDVYATLFSKWNLRIFNNISRSEQQHTSRVKELLDKYQLDDPVANLAPGQFNNPEFQALYDKLVKQGTVSLVEALKVGATIEDLDIKDLKDWLELTDNKDITSVYQNLEKGSRNHMRSFYKQLKQNGSDYQAQYISQNDLNKIINSPQERGKK